MDTLETLQPGDPALKTRALRGGAVTVTSQALKLVLATLSTVILVRLLSPADFGLVGMVTSVIGVLAVFKDGGLSAATVQRETLTDDQVSALFWANAGIGLCLGGVCAAGAQLLTGLYSEPRLSGIAMALSGTFVIGSLAVQHRALLRRNLRFRAIATVEIIAMTLSIGIAIALALAGAGYWALVISAVARTLIETVGAWLALPWVPGRPRRGCGVRPLLRFGGTLTCIEVLNYTFRNADSILIGWRWGPGALGLYQKAYSLLALPLRNINAPITGVMAAALSRVRAEPLRLRRYFITAHSAIAASVVPLIISTVLYADDVVILLLGEAWSEAADIFRFLGPAALVGALLNPAGALFLATGRLGLQLRLGLVWTTSITIAFAIGLPFGPVGVAAGYSAMSCVLLVPVIRVVVSGTSVTAWDLGASVGRPVIAGIGAGASGYILSEMLLGALPSLVRVGVGVPLCLAVYAALLLGVMGRGGGYRDLLRQARAAL